MGFCRASSLSQVINYCVSNTFHIFAFIFLAVFTGLTSTTIVCYDSEYTGRHTGLRLTLSKRAT